MSRLGLSTFSGTIDRWAGPVSEARGPGYSVAGRSAGGFDTQGAEPLVATVPVATDAAVASPADECFAWRAFSGHCAATADVRLDNRTELCALLAVGPQERNDISDLELIVRAFRKWGNRCPQYLLGDFAFAIWDGRRRTLFCARDHIGAKPFYYSLALNRILFAGELKNILGVPGVSDRLHEPYVAAHLLDGHFEHEELTFFESIRKLPPGCTLVVTAESASVSRYWDPAEAPEIRLASDGEYAEAFLELYEEAVRARLRGVGAFGAHLTGGLDSSSIAVLAARQLRQQGRSLTTYCWQPPGRDDSVSLDERTLIEAVCAQEALEVRYQSLSVHDLIRVLRRDITREPTVDTLIHEQLVQQQAEDEGVRVLLSGWGGDEFIAFNGRGHYADLLVRGHWRQLYQLCRQRARSPGKYLLKNAILPIMPPSLGQFVRRIGCGRGTTAERLRYLDHEFIREMQPAAAALQPGPWREVGVRQTQLQLLGLGHLTQRIESWAESGARHRLVYRYPLLDRRVMEFALGLPPEQFVKGSSTRHLMRNALDGVVPPEVRWNRDKSDPVRSRVLSAATQQAYARVGRYLANLPTNPSRSIYVNTRGLRDRLNAPRPIGYGESDCLWRALQFLDF